MFDKWISNFSQNFPTIDNENGKIENIIAFSLNNTNKSGIFAKIDFEIINEGVANINLTNVIISDKNANQLNMSIKNASISMDLKSPQTNITFGNPKYGLYIKSITPIWLNSTDNFGINR